MKPFQIKPVVKDPCPVNFFKHNPDNSVSVVQDYVFPTDFEAYEIDTLLANNIDVANTKVDFTADVSVDTLSAIEDNISKNVESYKKN